MSRNDTRLVTATTWVTNLVRHSAELSKIGVISIEWRIQDNLVIMEIEGSGGKKASKLFEPAELASFPLEGPSQVAFEAQLTRLIQFFKRK